MKYRIRHRTVYHYETHASVSHNVLYLQPRTGPYQQVERFRTTIHPTPTARVKRQDAFGNPYEVVAVATPHQALKIAADGIVIVSRPPKIEAETTLPWETIRNSVDAPSSDAALVAAEFAFESPLAPYFAAIHDYARASFPSGTPVLAGAIDLMGRIYREFRYDAASTTVTTPVTEVFEKRRGVCQDFAHVMLSALRALGLSARYVSGYLETLPPPGQPRLLGVDASHAWVSVFVGEAGWVDLDPTNNLLPEERHVTLAYGRDYQDVTPVRGVILGGGAHLLTVSVDMTPSE